MKHVLFCKKCKSTERLIKHSKNRKKTIQYYYCNLCNAEKMRKYYKTENGRKVIIERNKRYEKKNRERVLAWRTAQNYITKQEPCIICGKLPSQMHHPNIKERLNIIFLCAYHHRQADKQLKKTNI